MLRLKVVLTFVLSILILAGVSFLSYRGAISDAIQEDTELSLRRAASVAELERKMMEATLVAKASYVGSAPDLYEAVLADYSTRANPEEGGEPLEVEPKVATHERHLKVHERLNRYRIEFEQYYQGGEGKGARQLDTPLQWQQPTQPDLYFAVDRQGVGLAAIGKDLLKWYNSDVSKQQILVSEALTKKQVRTGLIEWSYEAQDSKGLYLVAIAPIAINREQELAGAVVVGSLISDGTAKRAREMMAGVYEQGLDEQEAKAVLAKAPEVAYFYNGKIVSSTFDNSRQKEVESKLLGESGLLEGGDERSATIEIGDDEYLVRVRMMPAVGDGEKKAGIITLSNLSAELEPLSSPGANTWLAAVMILLLGSIALLIFIQLFRRPIEKIESGMQEVVAGNKDYVFEYRGSNKLAQGLAHQLNLMSAYLQGKPMPDDEDGGGNWADMGVGSNADPAPSGSARVQGVNMADLMGKKPSNDQDG